jgi:hypothetical protein
LRGPRGDEARRQRTDVTGPLAQRRDAQREHAQPVVEIFAEHAVPHGLLEIAVARREHAHVERNRFGGAERLDLALLQHAQQLRLEAQVHFRDFVEQQRSGICLHELADTARLRPRECAFLVAEQQGLEHLLGDGCAIDGDERPGVALRARVDESREHLLAGAALAIQQYRDVALRDARGKLEQLAARGILGDGRR